MREELPPVTGRVLSISPVEMLIIPPSAGCLPSRLLWLSSAGSDTLARGFPVSPHSPMSPISRLHPPGGTSREETSLSWVHKILAHPSVLKTGESVRGLRNTAARDTCLRPAVPPSGLLTQLVMDSRISPSPFPPWDAFSSSDLDRL